MALESTDTIGIFSDTSQKIESWTVSTEVDNSIEVTLVDGVETAQAGRDDSDPKKPDTVKVIVARNGDEELRFSPNYTDEELAKVVDAHNAERTEA